MSTLDYDVVIIGAGAAGLMCAIQAGQRGRRVLVLDHANKVGKKIIMSGGGRCNFTNYHISPEKYISHNPHFVKSALSRYTQWDFIKLVEQHGIPYYEKTLGQLFCKNKSKEIVQLLLKECEQARVKVHLKTAVNDITKNDGESGFILATTLGTVKADSVVIATGGLSIPTMGATSYGYKIAKQFGLNVYPTTAALVPFTFKGEALAQSETLSGVALPAVTSNSRISFKENILFTHRGLSGPACLQMSSYWQAGEPVRVNLLPEMNLVEDLQVACQNAAKKKLRSILCELLPKRLVLQFVPEKILDKNIQEISQDVLQSIARKFHEWQIWPSGTEGFKTAEVTLGGVDTNELSSKTMESKKVPGLYFIGEVVDVTGWLGGYNFQWAWSSGWAAGQVV